MGLNLLCLLSQNRVSEFHTELERLEFKFGILMFIISVVRLQPSSNLNNVYIKHPVSLEQYIMEGSCAEAGRMLNLSEMTEFARKRDWKVMRERSCSGPRPSRRRAGCPVWSSPTWSYPSLGRWTGNSTRTLSSSRTTSLSLAPLTWRWRSCPAIGNIRILKC